MPKLKTISFICGFAFEKPIRNFEKHFELINSESISFDQKNLQVNHTSD